MNQIVGQEEKLEDVISRNINKKETRKMCNSTADDVNKLNKLKPRESKSCRCCCKY